MSNALCTTNKEIPQEMLLGNLLFMNLTDMRIPAVELTDIFKNNGLPEHYVRKISAADAYRRASSDLKGRKIWWDDGNGIVKVECRIEIDEVKCDVDSIKRILGIKHIDEGSEEVNYIPVAELTFNRVNQQASSLPLIARTDVNYSEVQKALVLYQNNFSDWSVYHNKATVRNIVNRVVADTHPINLMPTGLCKFTPANHGDTLYALKAALGEMSAYGIGSNAENIVEIIPIIDTDEQRSLVEKNYTMEVTDEMNRLVTELRTVLANKASINSRTAASYIERFKFLKDKADDYGNLLNVYTQALQVQLADAIRLVNDNTEVKGSA